MGSKAWNGIEACFCRSWQRGVAVGGRGISPRFRRPRWPAESRNEIGFGGELRFSSAAGRLLLAAGILALDPESVGRSRGIVGDLWRVAHFWTVAGEAEERVIAPSGD